MLPTHLIGLRLKWASSLHKETLETTMYKSQIFSLMVMLAKHLSTSSHFPKNLQSTWQGTKHALRSRGLSLIFNLEISSIFCIYSTSYNRRNPTMCTERISQTSEFCWHLGTKDWIGFSLIYTTHRFDG